MRGKRIRYLGEYLVFRTLVCVVQACSPRLCARFAEWLAMLLHYGLPRRWTRYATATANLRQAFGAGLTDAQIDRLVYRMWVHLFRLVAEVIHLPRKVRLNNIVDVVDFRGKAGVVRALCSDRPVLLLSGHFGNWEMAISVFGLFGFPMGLVARELDNPYLDRWFYGFRKYTGHRPIPKKGGFDQMLERLQGQGALAMLADQDAGPGGVFVNFFGHPASTHKSIALLALEYNALICVGTARRLNETLPNGWPRFELGCETVIDPALCQSNDPVHEITQQFTLALENEVRRAPEQYFWVHRRWKSVPRVRRKGKNRPALASAPTSPSPSSDYTAQVA